LLVPALAFLLSACVGKTLSNTKELEEYNLRSATPQEEEKLKKCARSIRDEQNKYRQKHKTYQKSLKSLPVDEACSDIAVRLQSNGVKYEATLRLNENNSTVKWVLNEKGEVTELLEDDIQEDLF
jgi:hypothetical protein